MKTLKLTADEFEELTEDIPHLGIRDMKQSPLILVQATGNIISGTTGRDKDDVVEEFDEATDVLLFAWAGQWKTNVFRLTKADIEKHYR